MEHNIICCGSPVRLDILSSESFPTGLICTGQAALVVPGALTVINHDQCQASRTLHRRNKTMKSTMSSKKNNCVPQLAALSPRKVSLLSVRTRSFLEAHRCPRKRQTGARVPQARQSARAWHAQTPDWTSNATSRSQTVRTTTIVQENIIRHTSIVLSEFAAQHSRSSSLPRRLRQGHARVHMSCTLLLCSLRSPAGRHYRSTHL